MDLMKITLYKAFYFFLRKASTLQLLKLKFIYTGFLFTLCGLYALSPNSAMAAQHRSYLVVYRTLGSQVWVIPNTK